MAYNGNNTKFPINISNAGIKADLYNVYEEIGSAFPPPPGDYWVQENGDYWLQVNGDAWVRIT